MEEFFKQINFPYNEVREGQDKFIKSVYDTVKEKSHLLVSAPTGIGKTVSALAPALYYAKARGLTVICLTSRQTQANQIIQTIKDIQDTSKQTINHVAFIGKRSMCIHDDRDLYPAQDFLEFCKKTRDKGKCGHYLNTKNGDLEEYKQSIIENSAGMGVEEFIELCRQSRPSAVEFPTQSQCGFCPYELAGDKAYQSDVVICDFNYLFQQGIRDNFLGKIGRPLEECVVIVDEAHNLPDRIRNAYSYSLSSQMIEQALKELYAFSKDSSLDSVLKTIQQTIEKKVASPSLQEIQVESTFIHEEIFDKINDWELEEFIEALEKITLLVKEEKMVSHCEKIANFLKRWSEFHKEEGYLHLVEKTIKKSKVEASLQLKCLDSSSISSEVLSHSFSTIFMSATLSPITMYKDILGAKNAKLLELDSPFAHENQLTLVDDSVTTKFSSRSPTMFEKIGKRIETALQSGFGKNVIVFFPSYQLLDQILSTMNLLSLERRVLREMKSMTKEEKEKIVNEFKSTGGFAGKSKVLFAVTSGSFAEGLDLPSTALEMVIVVGLPLSVPDITTNALINYYDKKFKKGQMYGYVYPAMSKIIQAGGRCIRTERDRGAIILLDNRFFFPLYAQAFPKHWKLRKSQNLEIDLGNFFSQ